MSIYGEPSLFFYELCQLLQWAEHQIDDLAATTALNMMVVRSAMNHLIPHLPFMKPDGIHQTKLLEHGQVTVNRHKIDTGFGLNHTRVHLGHCNRECIALENGENGLSGLRQLLPASLETLRDRSFHGTSYMQLNCNYQFGPSHVKPRPLHLLRTRKGYTFGYTSGVKLAAGRFYQPRTC